MKNFIALIVIVLIILSACRNGAVNTDSAFEEFADSLFQVNVDSNMIAGASVLIYQKGQILLDKHYGFASLELSVPIPEDASFEIGSVTKQFTSAAILMLANEGELSLDDDFTKYLDFDSKGRKVTIRHLLNHTSGIPSYTEMQVFGDLVTRNYRRDTLLKLVEEADFLFEPGEALIYNNSAYFFLGLIIEKVTGMSYSDYLKEKIFNPLDMLNTYYCSNSAIVKNKVYGYGFSPEGLQQKSYLDHTWPYAAGSLGSSTSDLLTWLRALHEGDILSDDMYKAISSPDKLNDGTELRYAFGLTNFLDHGNRCIGHGGGINGFLSETKYYPEHNLYIICLVNTVGPMGAGVFADELTWKLIDKKDYESSNIDIDLESLSGRYNGQGRGSKLSITVEALPHSITWQNSRQENPDTLSTYIGNSTWINGNTTIEFRDGVCRIDDVFGHYVLKKQ